MRNRVSPSSTLVRSPLCTDMQMGGSRCCCRICKLPAYLPPSVSGSPRRSVMRPPILSLALLFGVAAARISRRDLAESFTRHAVIDDLRVAAKSKQGPWAAEWSPSAEDAEMPSHLNVGHCHCILF